MISPRSEEMTQLMQNEPSSLRAAARWCITPAGSHLQPIRRWWANNDNQITSIFASGFGWWCQTLCSGGQTDFRSLSDAACVQVRARSMSIFFAPSVLDWRDQRIASSAYSRNCSAFDICALRFERPRAGESLPVGRGSLSKTAHISRNWIRRLLRLCWGPA
jgi:hypothetical protein